MCATLINHGERLIVPSGHYMHSLIDAVNELPVLTYNATTAWPRARRPGPGVGSGRTAVLHRMVHYAWDRSGGWGASVRAHVLACGGVRACERDSVCYNIRVSLPWTLQFLISGQALGFTLLKDWMKGQKTRGGSVWVPAAAIVHSLFKKEAEAARQSIVHPPSPLLLCPPFFFNQTERWNEKHKARNHMGRLKSWLLCHLSTTFNRRRKGSPCYTISYWLAVINRDRQHASSIPINCFKQERK